jgi:hypothetical protein
MTTSNDYRALCAELLAALEIQLDELRFYNRLCKRARTLLAAPEAVGVSDEELEDFAYEHGGGFCNCDCQEEADMLARKHVSTYRLLLSRYGTAHHAPVPVGERLPGVEDCDAEGTCWVWNFTAYTWGLFRLDLTAHSHWLPHWALPLPQEAQP